MSAKRSTGCHGMLPRSQVTKTRPRSQAKPARTALRSNQAKNKQVCNTEKARSHTELQTSLPPHTVLGLRGVEVKHNATEKER